MSNVISFPDAGGTPSPFHSSRPAFDPADPHDVQLVTAKLKEVCFEITRLTRQFDDPNPHCPLNITQRVTECSACQRGEPGHVGDLAVYQAALFQCLQELEVEKDLCRRFLTEAHQI